jgi:hypothetical protein
VPNGTHLTHSAQRALAGAMIRAARPDLPPVVATTLADILDLVSATLLRAGADLSDREARAVLQSLWT